MDEAEVTILVDVDGVEGEVKITGPQAHVESVVEAMRDSADLEVVDVEGLEAEPEDEPEASEEPPQA
jgi:hypothetical protein